MKFVFSVCRLVSPTVPQYLTHVLSCNPAPHRTGQAAFPTSGSSACHSVSLRSTKRVQVFADTHTRPAHPGQCLVELIPVVCLTLTLAVDPFVQDTRCVIDISGTPLCVIGDGVVVQVPLYARLSAFEHLAFAQLVPRAARPIGKLAQTAPDLLAAGSAFDLEVSILGLPTNSA